MAYQDCINSIREAVGKEFPDDEIEAIVSEIDKRLAKRKAVNPLENDALALAEIAKNIADEEKFAAMIEKRSRLKNVIAKRKRLDIYSRFVGREAEAIKAFNVGSEKVGEGLGKSVNAAQVARRSELLGPMAAELRAANLFDILGKKNEPFEREIADNMWLITEAEVAGKSPVLTGRKEAQDAARIFVKYQEAARTMQNNAGAWIGRAPGYIVRQSHDMLRIRKAGIDAWATKIKDKLDPKTFDGVDEPDAFLRRIGSELASGVYYKTKGADSWLGGFKGPSNRAKKLSQNRVLHFKSAKDWYEYNKEFGMGGIVDSVIHGLNSAADNSALMEAWGTNPQAAFDADLDMLRERARDRGDMAGADALKGRMIKAQFEQLTGEARIPGNPNWAKFGAVSRALINMSSLGGVVLSSIPDNALKVAVLRHHGIGYFEGYGNAFGDLIKGRSSGEKREIADLLGAGMHGMLGDIASIHSATDTLPGKVAKMQNFFFKINFMSWWADSKSTGAGLMMSHNLARNADKPFSQLDGLLQNTLKRYDIGDAQWNALRQTDMRVDGDRAYMMPDSVDDLSDDIIKTLGKGDSATSIARAREDLKLNLRMFFSEELQAVNTFGGAGERAIVTWGTQPGTLLGEAVRFIMQFKMFPITYIRKHVARELYRGGVPGMVHMILATTALGYIANSAKQLAAGKEPRPLTTEDGAANWATIGAAAVQGGGLGIYGDFLMGQYNRFGGGGLETLMGPGIGKTSDILRAFATAREGEPLDAAAKLAWSAKSMVPGANLFYTKAGLDYLIFYQLQEIMNPGYLKRMESRIKRDNDQTFYIPPSSTMPRGGGNRLFEGVR